MKLKSSLFIVAATAGLATSASALTIDIVGSTAGRSAVLSKVTTLISPTYTAYNSADGSTKSDQIIMKGTYASAPIIVRFNFTGSAAGVQQVAGQISTVPFYREDLQTIDADGGVVTFSGNTTNSAPEIGYSDVFQSTTAFKTPALTSVPTAIIPFKFFKSKGDTNTDFDNISSQQVRELYGVSGSAPLSFFTGDPNDSSEVFATGRDAFSGTRITTFAETGTSQTAVSQYQPTVSGGAVTVLGSTSPSGYASGSGVKTVVNASYSGGTMVGYMGASDWPAAENAGTTISLKFNGVPYSKNALVKGQYTFWGYLHQFHLGLTGTSLNFFNAVKDAIILAPGSGLEPTGDMECSRGGDGAVVVPNGGA